jgi:hypothetical protein
MRITNQNQMPIPSTETNTNAAAASAGDAPTATTSHLSASLQEPQLVPSFELRSLTAALQQIPSTRNEVVSATMRRLASGQLQSPAALEATANAILGE